jgi:hypothetical protein
MNLINMFEQIGNLIAYSLIAIAIVIVVSVVVGMYLYLKRP